MEDILFYPGSSNAGTWVEKNILHASDLQADDSFGWSVSISGDYAIVGAYVEDGGTGDPASNAGAAYIFERNATSGIWEQKKILHASDLQASDSFGQSVAINGDNAVVGAYFEDGGTSDPASNAGAAYIFERNATSETWEQKKILHASDLQADDSLGQSVAISNDYAVVGASGEDGGTGDPASNAGAAYVYELK